MPRPTFSDVLDNACRSAGLDPDNDVLRENLKRSRNAASRLERIADRLIELASRATASTASFNPYLEHADDPATPSERRQRKSSDPVAVAAELRITPQMSLADLNRLRREFALANHPDRVDLAERADATRRMMLANMLIDRELKRRIDPSVTG